MSITSTAHLNVRGDARQALEFYHSVFGGQLVIATYGQFGVPQDDPNGGPVTFGPVAPTTCSEAPAAVSPAAQRKPRAAPAG